MTKTTETPERRARLETLAQAARDASGDGLVEHTVTVEVAREWDDDRRLADLLIALDARPELLGSAVGAHVRQRVIGVTVTVEAKTEKAAREVATRALADELRGIGLA